MEELIILISGIIGTGGLGAMLQYVLQRKTAKLGHALDINKSRDVDERQFRRDLMRQLDNREQKHQEQLKNYDERLQTMLAQIDALDAKYRSLASDYADLSDRYISQAKHIQSATSVILERDHWRRQAEIMEMQVLRLSARVAHLEAEIAKIQGEE